MSKIKDVIGREILDSRGNPTVEVDVVLESGIVGRAAVPSGASTGEREALELRDGGTRYMGKGVLKAVSHVNNELRNLVIGYDVFDQKALDYAMIELDGTETKSRFGANAILGVSMAAMKAAALEKGLPLYRYVGDGTILPKPMMNIINGGAHADNKLDFQEFMIIPQADTIKERVRIGSEVFHNLKKVLNEKGLATGVGDEGGFAPDLNSNTEGFELIMEAIKRAGYEPGVDVKLGIDVAASEFYKDGKYVLAGEGRSLTTEELVDFFEELVNKYPICSIEDPVDENDWEGFRLITERLGDRIQLVGDDLFVTNKKCLQMGIDEEHFRAICKENDLNYTGYDGKPNHGILFNHATGNYGTSPNRVVVGSPFVLENGCKIELEYGDDTNKTVIVQDIVNGNNASIQSQFVQDRAVLIVPMSFFQWLLNDDTAIELTINTAQHEEVAECLADTGFFQVVDVASTTENSRQTYMLLKMMVCIFTVLMTMIIGLNVCNTISNTIDVRRSEFAVLQSVGMTSGGLKKMLLLESVLYGMKSLIFAIPISLIIHYVMYSMISKGMTPFVFYINWGAYGIAVIMVALVVVTAMLFSLRSIEKVEIVKELKTGSM